MDNKLTEKIGKFLAKENPTTEEIKKGAELLLQLDPGRERGIYNSALIRPQSFLPWIRTDLRKFYKIRQRGLTNKDAVKYNAETISKVEESLKTVPDGASPAYSSQAPAMEHIKGKRTDHDSLPDNIKALWDKNVTRWDKMRKLHTQLEQMIAKPGYQACDGNELCYQLRQLDNSLRADYASYDNYKPEEKKQLTPEEEVQEKIKQINLARVYISRHLSKETLTDDEIDMLQDAVNLLHAEKANMKEDTINKLKAVGVVIPEDKDNA
ncbi:MAG: hypothetical protein LKE54_03630 [Prevotella sp.]|jgi:hypothetical protein|nr:hypothetical protein [Prevotella sp.]MCH3994137.1 hypothetical protein [Prevotella sp.]